MTESVKGKTKAEAFQLFESMHRMLISTPGSPVDSDKLGKLAVFSGVREFPVRVKCASLAWHTLQAAIQGVAETVTTE
jgi:nitrogen fixation NifU-like protein